MTRPVRLATTILLSTLLGFAIVSTPGPLAATDFPHYDKLNDEAQTEYLVLMVAAMEQAFRNAGHADLAAQMEKLFTDVEPGDSMTLGMVELVSNVDRARVADAERFAKDHQSRRLDVEDALFVTLKKNNMMLTSDEMTQVVGAMASYHWMTFAEFEQLTPPEQHRLINLDANLGFFTFMLFSEVKDVQQGKKTDPNEEKSNALMERQVVNDEFLSAGEPGYSKVKQQIADGYAKKPNDPGILYTVVQYVLSETANRIDAEMKKMEDSTYHLGSSPQSQQSAWQQFADYLKKLQAASNQSPATSAPAPSSRPSAAPPAPAATSLKDSAADDDPIGGGGFITPPSSFPAMLCVEQSLVDNQAFNAPPAGGKMAAFKNIAATYIHDTAKPDWQYLLRQQNYDRFNPSTTPSPNALVLSVSPDDHDVFGGCPAGYAQYQMQISR